MRLNRLLLRAASTFWDHTHNVFHFNKCELFPMMEVFGAIMGLSNFDNILFPPLAANPIILLNEILSLSYKVGAIWVEKDGFDVHA